jgi:trehalose synthase
VLAQVKLSHRRSTESTTLDSYEPFVGKALIEEIRHLAEGFKGLRICNVNATASGGGVAELLSREIPILQDLGVKADWRVIHGDKKFFEITKAFHNALQGAKFELAREDSQEYLDHNKTSAENLDTEYDIYIVHDPQPAAIRHFAPPNHAKWIWRCHIDSSSPNPQVWGFLRPYVEAYDAAIFTMQAFRPADLQMKRTAFIAPAIDPLSTKNMELPRELCRRVISDSGIDLEEPLLLQVSRFDPWKDPLGVIEAYRQLKKSRPGVQLALIGAMAGDDPEGWKILEAIDAEALNDPDLHVYTNLTGFGNMEVNAFQCGADLVIQKSLKEGFGLVVSEALWKRRAVVAGRAGGIPMQFPPEYDAYLVNSVEECAQKLLYLLDHPDQAEAFGKAGRKRVAKNFLLPRLVRDQLKLFGEVLQSQK